MLRDIFIRLFSDILYCLLLSQVERPCQQLPLPSIPPPTMYETEFPIPNIFQRECMLFPFPNSGKDFGYFLFLSQTAGMLFYFPVPIPHTGKAI